MCAPFFRAAQQPSPSPFAQITITLPLLKVRHKACARIRSLEQTIWFHFTDLTVENGDPETPPLPSVWRIVRLTVIPCTKEKEPIDEPIYFSIHLYWDVIKRTEKDGSAANGNALVRMAYARAAEYVETHRYPARSEEYDPIVLEIW